MDTPELDKLNAVEEEYRAQASFLDWLRTDCGITLCVLDARGLWTPARKRPEEILGLYHGLDQGALEDERRALLESLREDQ